MGENRELRPQSSLGYRTPAPKAIASLRAAKCYSECGTMRGACHCFALIIEQKNIYYIKNNVRLFKGQNGNKSD